MSDEEAFVREYLAAHDVACPGCGYNLRGLERALCPECGATFKFAVREMDALSEADRMALWLRTHDLVCKKCKRNLRGHTSNVCPGCGTSYMLQHLAGEREPELGKKRNPLVPSWNVVVLLVALALLMVPAVRQGVMWVVAQLERVFR